MFECHGYTVRLCGELDMSAVPAMRQAVHAALVARPRAVRLDMSAVVFVDACAIGALVELARDAGVAGSRLELAGVSGRVRRILAMLDMDGFLALAAEPFASAPPD